MKIKLRFLIIAAAAILVTLLNQPTLAFYSTVGTATNVITTGGIRLQIHEKTSDGKDFPKDGVYVVPGDVVGKRVMVENVCSHPFYLRVKLISSTDNQALTPDDCLKLDLNQTQWIQQEDGYLYYYQILQPGHTTEPVFTQVEIVGQQVTQDHIGNLLRITVSAEAVQSENNPATYPWDAAGWPGA